MLTATTRPAPGLEVALPAQEPLRGVMESTNNNLNEALDLTAQILAAITQQQHTEQSGKRQPVVGGLSGQALEARSQSSELVRMLSSIMNLL